MASRRTLASLPSDVLLEILKLVLLDTPRSPQRAAVLRTCTLLNDLGIPLLYRIVDLTGMESRSTATTHWKRLFGLGGLFGQGTKTTRGLKVGSFVRELRLGGGVHNEVIPWEDFQIPSLLLPRCSTLFLECFQLSGSHRSPLKHILSQLPIAQLVANHRERESYWGDRFPIIDFGYGWTLAEHLGFDPQSWENLERIVFRDCLWSDKAADGSGKVSCSGLSFKVVVVEVPACSDKAGVKSAMALFLPSDLKEDERFLADVERIEFRISGEFAPEMEESFREEVSGRVARGLSSLERRLLPLFAFVSEDGTEEKFEGIE